MLSSRRLADPVGRSRQRVGAVGDCYPLDLAEDLGSMSPLIALIVPRLRARARTSPRTSAAPHRPRLGAAWPARPGPSPAACTRPNRRRPCLCRRPRPPTARRPGRDRWPGRGQLRHRCSLAGKRRALPGPMPGDGCAAAPARLALSWGSDSGHESTVLATRRRQGRTHVSSSLTPRVQLGGRLGCEGTVSRLLCHGRGDSAEVGRADALVLNKFGQAGGA